MDEYKPCKLAALAALAIALLAAGCSIYFEQDRPPGALDAGVTPDAASLEPDAMPAPDAVAPWEPPDLPVIEGDPCEIVSDEPEAMYDAGMANYSVRFRDGQGLEQSPDLRQAGLLEVENADLDKRDAVEKRLGVDVLLDTLSTGGSVPDADRRAIWTRGDEVVLQTHDAIYKQNQVTTGSQWRRAGNFIQARLRDGYAGVLAVDVKQADHARVGDAIAVAYQDTAGATAPRFAVYGPEMALEFQETLGGVGKQIRLSAPEDFVVVTFQESSAGFPLNARIWTPGNDNTNIFQAVFATMGSSDGIWDVHSAKTADADDTVTAWVAAAPTANDFSIEVRINGVTGTATNALPNPLLDAAVAVWPRRVTGGTLVRTVSAYVNINAGNQRLTVTFADWNPTTGALVAATTSSQNLADPVNATHAVALSFVDRNNVYVAVEQTDPIIAAAPDPARTASRKVTYYTVAIGGPVVATGIIHYATTLATQGAIVAGTPSDTLVTGGAAPLSPVFVEQLIGISSDFSLDNTALPRNGWVMFAPRTQEVIARSFVGYTGNFLTRSVREAKGSLVSVGDNLTWGGPVSVLSEPVSDPLDAIAVCTVDRAQVPNAPAVSDGSAFSANAGYPRGYDGTNAPFEMDWHTLPRLFSTTPNTGAGTPFLSGNYTLAATWEWDDANGIRYRSAPGFFNLPSTLASVNFQSFDCWVETLTHTERTNVRLVFWCTSQNGVSLHRLWETAVTNTSRRQAFDPDATQIPNLASYSSINAAIEAQETLDQGDVPLTQGVVPAERARVTDFMARAGDRLHSRDPLQGKIHRFSIPSREATGFAMHWPLAFAVEEPEERDVTSVLEMDGRIVVGSELGLALLTADGPDATGAGSFGIPTILRAEQGIRDQAVLARTPIGYAFGTRGGEPKILTPGLTVEDLAKQVERAYKIDGTNIVSIAYDQNREEMVFLANSGKTLRLNTSTGRWASDPNRLGRDLTVTKDGTLYLIRSDGKVLKQREDVWADGGVGYALKVSTPWIRDMARDGTTHSAFRLGAVYVSGEYLGPHDLFFDVYKDFNDVTPWGTFQVPEAQVVANAAANRGWIYGVRLGGRDSFLAARIVVRDGAEPNRTFRLAQMDIDILTDKSSQYAELPTTHYAARV